MRSAAIVALLLAQSITGFAPTPFISQRTVRVAMSSEATEGPTTFREAEVLGLRQMQEGSYEEALKTFKDGMKLPGSRPDILRSKLLSGPSPVGGAYGGLQSNQVYTLDEFELQAAYYNLACIYAQLNDTSNSVANLKLAFESGFDNYATVRGDPDLKAIQDSSDFQDLMDEVNPKKGFNPFKFLS